MEEEEELTEIKKKKKKIQHAYICCLYNDVIKVNTSYN